MSAEEANMRATIATMRMAQDEFCHEQFLKARQGLEAMGASREWLIGLTRAAFADMTRADQPDINEEELNAVVEAKTNGFMWLIDNV